MSSPEATVADEPSERRDELYTPDPENLDGTGNVEDVDAARVGVEADDAGSASHGDAGDAGIIVDSIDADSAGATDDADAAGNTRDASNIHDAGNTHDVGKADDVGNADDAGNAADAGNTHDAGDADKAGSATATGDEDDFGGFDDFGEFESGDETGLVQAVEATTLEPPTESEPARGGAEPEFAKVPVLESSEIGRGVEDKVRALLGPPPEAAAAPVGDGSTSTSHQLWQVLTEPSWVPVPDWSGSRIHKRLAVSLGVPLNLDESLPKVATRHMVLPTTSEDSVEGMQKVPEWSLLSLVSPEALQSMSADELRAHTATLAAAIASAEELKDAVESQEMDMLGEKNILEGMVESLLAYSQRNQRESLLRKASKSKR